MRHPAQGWAILGSMLVAAARPTAASTLAASALLVAAALALAPGTASARYLPQERVPVSSPVYRDLERLMASYDRAPLSFSTRPLRMQEILAYLNSLVVEYPSSAGDPAMIRARRAVDPDAPGAGAPLITVRDDSTEVATFSPYVSVAYEDDPRNRPDINRDYRVGAQVVAALDSTTIFVFDGYEGTASQGGRGTPNFGRLNSVIEGVDLNSWMDEAYAELKLARLRVLVGHASLRWGPGRDGTLALSDAAPPLDMVRLEAGFARKWRGQSFVALLDPGPQTYLAGHRLEWNLRDMRLGVTELARFDGTSQALLYSIPIVPYSFWEKRPKSAPDGAVPGDTTGLALSKNNVLLAVDLSWNVRRGYRLWGEFLVDDISFSSDYKPDMIGWQAGMEERWLLGGGGDGAGASQPLRAATLSLEYNRVNNYTYSAWHGHNFDFQGFPVGFVYGPDVMLFAAEATYEHGANWEFRLRGELRRKGEGFIGDAWTREQGKVDAGAISGIVERDARIAARLTWTPSRMLRLEGTVGYASFKNEDHRNVGVENETPFRLAARLEW
ncbi:MAG TPA: capsule assembly Wzi family protein [Candidatus Eisenbacteria bacterium]|nr:capsule assembly Wzi family protein [Candidatus Eisenbacteria bacterium]